MVELSLTLEAIARNRDALLETFCQDLVELVRVEGVGYVDHHILAERGSYTDFVYAKIRRDWEAGHIEVPDSSEDDEDDNLPSGFTAPDPLRTVHTPAAAFASDVGTPAFVKRRRAHLALPENADAGPSRPSAAAPSPQAPPGKGKHTADPSTPLGKKHV